MIIKTHNLILKRQRNVNLLKPYNQYWEIYKEDTCIGNINIESNERNFINCEIGYAISKFEQNKGYATESVKEICSYLFEHKTETIYAKYYASNKASARVLEKCAFTIIESGPIIKVRRCKYD